MKKKAYILLGIVLAAIFLICFLLYFVVGYFPILGNYIADTKLSAYANDKIVTQYDFLENIYRATDSDGNHLRYDLCKDMIHDELYNSEIDAQANQAYQQVAETPLFDTCEYPEKIFVYVQMDADDSSKKYVKLYIASIFESVSMSEEDSKSRMCKLVEQISTSMELNITAIQFVYANYDGMYELTCDFGKESVDQKDLKKYIRKKDEAELPMDYIEWRDNRKYKKLDIIGRLKYI